MPPAQSKVAHKIDSLMEQASEALVHRRYFECEKLALEALRRAIAAADYDRVARIVLPLQEARRQIRDLAADSGNIVLVEGDLPTGAALKPGMYLLSPPRVGVDGRILREEAMNRQIPAIVIVREPKTQAGLWPIVAVGPVTVRTRIAPPAASQRRAPAKSSAAAAKKGKAGARGLGSGPAPRPDSPRVDSKWMLLAGEALGDAAIAALPPDLTPAARVAALADRLDAIPDHEKLHQRLEEAAREAARLPVKRKPVPAQARFDPKDA